jgi:signal transduction histidine kinase/CheY-like chemotaxis protein
MTQAMLTVAIGSEHDVVLARQRARQVSALLGFDQQDQARIATAVSEIARNACRYAGGGRVDFVLEGVTAPQLLMIRVSDKGEGIADVDLILSGQYRSQTGMGLGIVGARRLMDQLEIRSQRGEGTEVVLKKLLPKGRPAIGARALAGISAELASKPPEGPLQELQQQNQEVLRTLSELRERQEDLLRLNRELEDTNRGVVALYAELDEKAGHLRRADEMKTRFLSNMSHEFRTPLNSIRAISRLLLDRTDGPLTAEQERQVHFIVSAAENLTELVDDLLDLAKIEAGKIDVRPVEFAAADFFSALRGMLRPLLVGEQVALVFEEPPPGLVLHTDEGKLSQILRNFISNALKFTPRGEVRVSATADEQTATFAVADTGIGIAPEDQELIFDEFTQVRNPLQARTKGTGLGLPLCRKLATLLGGSIELESAVGLGSTFSVKIPKEHRDRLAEAPALTPQEVRGIPVLVVDDEADPPFIYERYLAGTANQYVPARSLAEVRRIMQATRPRLIVLDILLRGEDSWAWLSGLKSDPETRDIPVIVVTTVEDERKALALGAEDYLLKPVDRATFLSRIEARVRRSVLVIDDDPAARYLVQRVLSGRQLDVLEAADGRSGLLVAGSVRPALIFLDLQLPDIRGEEVLRMLRIRSDTSNVPVAILTASVLSSDERQRLEQQAQAVVQKSDFNAERARELLARHGL